MRVTEKVIRKRGQEYQKSFPQTVVCGRLGCCALRRVTTLTLCVHSWTVRSSSRHFETKHTHSGCGSRTMLTGSGGTCFCRSLCFTPLPSYHWTLDLTLVAALHCTSSRIPAMATCLTVAAFCSTLGNLFVDLVFLIDIAVNFRTAQLSDEGSLITDPNEVARRYAHGWLVFDVIAGVPFVSFCAVLCLPLVLSAQLLWL